MKQEESLVDVENLGERFAQIPVLPKDRPLAFPIPPLVPLHQDETFWAMFTRLAQTHEAVTGESADDCREFAARVRDHGRMGEN